MIKKSVRLSKYTNLINLAYKNIPTIFKWDPLYSKDDNTIPRHKKGAWIRRINKRKVIGHIVPISKENKKLIAMRSLLIHRKGITSFDALKTIDSIEFQT
ncbi:Hypothetical protein SRAE_X000153600 [Strongyloides ratti]|uniref:Uncharacterized protein n=1 Tax=Strongyloides ratti TaxID=34506 RepID=A0A090KX39_STRRB|nr:Hypothetical protein SRAE_X000153600 [Strongyloides ratti]CEF59792.1 Hypothetical protein SRAE_X000153600 [Strongyloides ratti]